MITYYDTGLGLINHTSHSTAPNPPTDLMVVQASATSVTVSWTPPTDSTGVTGYQIFYNENGGSEQSKDVSGASTNMDTITGLTTGSTYSITILATSDDLPSELVGPEIIELGTTVLKISNT